MTEQTQNQNGDSQDRFQKKSVSAAKILQQVVLIQVQTHIWSASQALKPGDLEKVKATDLPPNHVASLGSKKLIDVTELNVFHTLKRAAQRVLETYGIEFMGGFAIPCTKIKEVQEALDVIEKKFIAAKEQFIKDYPDHLQNWIALNPTWERALTAKPVPVDKVSAGISFDWLATHVTEPKGKHAKLLARGFHKEVDSLSDKLFKEIATEAESILEDSFYGKDKVPQKCITRVSALETKLTDLGFLNTATTPLSSLIAYIRSLLPPNGFIEGYCFSALYQTLELLKSTEKSMEFAEQVNSGRAVEEVASEFLLKSAELASSQTFVQGSLDITVKPAQVVEAQDVSSSISVVTDVKQTETQLQAVDSEPVSTGESANQQVLLESPVAISNVEVSVVSTSIQKPVSKFRAVEFF